MNLIGVISVNARTFGKTKFDSIPPSDYKHWIILLIRNKLLLWILSPVSQVQRSW